MGENILILYYSRAGENYVNGSIQTLEKGNTQMCAEYIQKAVGGVMFEVKTVTPYAKDYHECTKEAMAELKANARPELITYLDDITGYDTVFVCGPCWWETYPMAMFSQLERLDFSGKRVCALMTHEGSGLGNVERDLKKVCHGASFGRGIAVHGADAKSAGNILIKWAKENIN